MQCIPRQMGWMPICGPRKWGRSLITETLRWCTNLESVNLGFNNITDELLLPIVEAIKGGCYTSLEHLYLHENRIGNSGCCALATLLADTNCNLKRLKLSSNQIGNEGATAIANSLADNTKIQTLYLRSNPFDPSRLVFFVEYCLIQQVSMVHIFPIIRWIRYFYHMNSRGNMQIILPPY